MTFTDLFPQFGLQDGSVSCCRPSSFAQHIDPFGSIITLRTILHRHDILFVPRLMVPQYVSALFFGHCQYHAVRTTARRNHQIVFRHFGAAIWTSLILRILASPGVPLRLSLPVGCTYFCRFWRSCPDLAVGQTHLLTQPLRSASFALSPSRLLLTPAPVQQIQKCSWLLKPPAHPARQPLQCVPSRPITVKCLMGIEMVRTAHSSPRHEDDIGPEVFHC